MKSHNKDKTRQTFIATMSLQLYHSLLRHMRQHKSKKIQVHNKNIQKHKTVKQTAREHYRNIHRKTENSKITAHRTKL